MVKKRQLYNMKMKNEPPGFVVGAEWVSVCLRVSTKWVGGPQVSRTAQTPPIIGLAAFLLSCHPFQQADLLLFLLPLCLVPQLPMLPLKGVAIAWECGIFLWQGVTDISERVTVHLGVLVAWHFTLGTSVRPTCTPRPKKAKTLHQRMALGC